MGAIAVVVAGGPLVAPWSGAPPPFDRVIAVDGGLDAALDAGLEPTVLLGDLDSVSSAGLAWATDRGLPVVRHPTDKDDTDTALALADVASSPDLSTTDVVVLGASAIDRFDHLLGTLLALGAPSLAAARSITAHLGATEVHVLHPGRACTLSVGAGRTVSLLALHGACTGVHISGVRWPLVDHTLSASSTLGVSNEIVADVAVVTHSERATGVLTVVIPPPFGAPAGSSSLSTSLSTSLDAPLTEAI